MRRWLAVTRWQEWTTSKLPFLLAMGLLLAPVGVGSEMVLLAMCTIAAWASFGYAVNDVADQEVDARAGKPNRAAGLRQGWLALMLIVFAAIAWGTAVIWSRHFAGTVSVVTGLALAAAYSLPPVRLKERGLIGVVSGGVAQWVLPVFALASLAPAFPAATWPAASLALCIGVRWMAVHQIMDLPADRRAGSHTFASTRRGRAERLVRVCFVGEILALGWLLACAWPGSAPAVLALLPWCVRQVLWVPLKPSFADCLLGYARAPLADYYFLLAPFALAIARVADDTKWLVISAGIAAMGWCYLEIIVGDYCERKLLDRNEPEDA